MTVTTIRDNVPVEVPGRIAGYLMNVLAGEIRQLRENASALETRHAELAARERARADQLVAAANQLVARIGIPVTFR